jgi:hypothetical protein
MHGADCAFAIEEAQKPFFVGEVRNTITELNNNLSGDHLFARRLSHGSVKQPSI